MKKTIRLIAAVLSLLTVGILVSCGGTAPVAKTFARGTVSGNVYTNSFAEMSFTKPGNWEFLTDTEIAALQGPAAEVFDEEAFNNASEASVIDMYAKAATGDNVNVSFSKGNAFTDVDKWFVADKCVAATTEQIKTMYESSGYSASIGEQTGVSVGGRDYQKVAVEVSVAGITMTQYCYFAQVGVYIVSIVCTTTTGMTEAQFEAMFSKAE